MLWLYGLNFTFVAVRRMFRMARFFVLALLAAVLIFSFAFHAAIITVVALCPYLDPAGAGSKSGAFPH